MFIRTELTNSRTDGADKQITDWSVFSYEERIHNVTERRLQITTLHCTHTHTHTHTQVTVISLTSSLQYTQRLMYNAVK